MFWDSVSIEFHVQRAGLRKFMLISGKLLINTGVVLYRKKLVLAIGRQNQGSATAMPAAIRQVVEMSPVGGDGGEFTLARGPVLLTLMAVNYLLQCGG